MVLGEAAAYYKQQGKTLWDAMIEIYDEFGYYADGVESITLKGKEGIEKIGSIMETIRENPLTQVGDYPVVTFRDYKTDKMLDVASGKVTPTGLPSSNVLYFDLPDGAWICLRPSGTEPKLKYYFGIKGDSLADADVKLNGLKEEVEKILRPML